MIWSVYKTNGYSVEKAVVDLCRGDRVQAESKLLQLRRSRSKKDESELTEEKTKVAGKMAEDVYSRMKWDGRVDTQGVVIGYEDRFLGVQEVRQFSREYFPRKITEKYLEIFAI